MAQELTTMAGFRNPCKIQSKRKAVAAFFPYAVWRERDGEAGMIEAFSGAIRASGSTTLLWSAIRPFIPALFDEASPRTIVLVSPHIPWHGDLRDEDLVMMWAEAVSEVPYTEEVGQDVIDAILHIASTEQLGPQIPVGIWSWLNRRPSLPPACHGRSVGTKRNVVRQIRGLGDIGILKSYLLLVWSEWDCIFDRSGYAEMQISIQEDFGGIGMGGDRRDLVERLDHIQGQLALGLGHLKQHKLWTDEDIRLAKRQYQRLKEVLLDVDKEVMEVLTRKPS